MTSSNFLIGPIEDGLRKDTRPWAIPEDAFSTMTNAYQYRGRIVRRSGYTKLGVLANGTPVMGLRTQERFNINVQNLIAFDTTTAYLWNGTVFVVLPSVVPVVWSGTNYQFFYTINYADAFWATNSKPGLNGYKLSNIGVNAFTNAVGINVDVNAPGNIFQGPTVIPPFPGDNVYFLNSQLNNLRQGIVTVAGNPFTVEATDGLGPFTSGPSNTGIVLSTTRQTPGQDGIRYYGQLTIGNSWANYNPPIDPNNALAGALLIFAYRGYLVFLNTWEGNESGISNFGNRARWTQIGTPYYSDPVPQSPAKQGVDPNAARDDLFGRGGANDAPTNEVIVSAEFIRDILVVYFERSTWRLRFVNNAQNPFVWERVNIELGSECTFSTIPFDKGLMTIGNRGIVISDGNDTSRFDEKIPNQIFDIRQSNFGLQRVYGIRTFRTRLNYWTFPSANATSGTFPDQVLVFNYDSKNWSIFDDSFTCFGYYYKTGNAITWNDLPDAWESYTNISWNSGVSQEGYENIVAGNQQGYVFVLEQQGIQNDPSLSISAITPTSPGVFTSNNNNLKTDSWITLSGVTGSTSDDGVSLNDRNFKFVSLNANDFNLTEFKPINAGTATGALFTYTISYKNIIPGSFQINVGFLVFKDIRLDGDLVESTGLGNGIVDYKTGKVILNFIPPIGPSDVIIRLVTLDPMQGFDEPVNIIGAYTGGGEIAVISGIDIQTKIFNFFKDDKRSRLSKIDFYMDSTANGQFTCNVFADSSNVIVNKPLSDNPQSNIVLTSPNPYQIGTGDEAIYRLYCDALAQTIQVQLTLSDYQLAVNAINSSQIEILAMMFTLRRGGRLV